MAKINIFLCILGLVFLTNSIQLDSLYYVHGKVICDIENCYNFEVYCVGCKVNTVRSDGQGNFKFWLYKYWWEKKTLSISAYALVENDDPYECKLDRQPVEIPRFYDNNKFVLNDYSMECNIYSSTPLKN